MRSNYDYNVKNHNQQTHTHEYLGSVKIAAPNVNLLHNHRFAGVTEEAIPFEGSHIHKLEGKTDFSIGHFHILADRTGKAIPVGNGKHVHFVYGQTTIDADHRHDFCFATLIDDPTDRINYQ